MKIAILLNLPAVLLQKLQVLLPSHTIIPITSKTLPEKQLAVADAEVIIGEEIEQEVLEAATHLKLIQVPWVGTDRVDFAFLSKHRKQVKVCNSKWNDLIVAEYAVSLLLASSKKIVASDHEFRQGNWESRHWGTQQIHKSKILLVGFGAIGKQIARLLQPFSANVVALRRSTGSIPDNLYVKRVITWQEYAEEAATTDYVIVTLPLTRQTRGILNKTKLLMLKPGAIIINVSRGTVIEEEALFKALESKHLGGAALDVWYQYPGGEDPFNQANNPFFPSKYPFHTFANVIMTPHRASIWRDAVNIYWDDVVYNINALEQGVPLKNVISLEQEY